jgi:hypothetical protein
MEDQLTYCGLIDMSDIEGLESNPVNSNLLALFEMSVRNS